MPRESIHLLVVLGVSTERETERWEWSGENYMQHCNKFLLGIIENRITRTSEMKWLQNLRKQIARCWFILEPPNQALDK